MEIKSNPGLLIKLEQQAEQFEQSLALLTRVWDRYETWFCSHVPIDKIRLESSPSGLQNNWYINNGRILLWLDDLKIVSFSADRLLFYRAIQTDIKRSSYWGRNTIEGKVIGLSQNWLYKELVKKNLWRNK